MQRPRFHWTPKCNLKQGNELPSSVSLRKASENFPDLIRGLESILTSNQSQSVISAVFPLLDKMKFLRALRGDFHLMFVKVSCLARLVGLNMWR
jgi:hypothetical protein